MTTTDLKTVIAPVTSSGTKVPSKTPTPKKGRGASKPKQPVIWTPQPKQQEALVRTEFEVLYGGARGGGKTDTGIAWLLYPVWDWLNAIKAKDFEKAARLSRYRALIIRKNADDLKDWTDRAEALYTRIFGNQITFTGKPVEIKFGDGPIFRTGHLKDADAYQKYQGHEYQRVLVEELTQIPAVENYEDLISSCRSTIPEIEAQVFNTTNPDGPGFWWVKDRFQIPEWPPQEPIKTTVDITLPDGRVKHSSRVFIRALLEDNPKLQDADVGYETRIAGMADTSRVKAWLQGYWGAPIIEGVIFNEELKKMHESGRVTEVAFDIKKPVYTYWDIGRDATPILFFQLVGNMWHMIDFYEASGQGFSHYAEVLRQKSTELGYWYGQHFGPHDLAKTDMNNETIWKIAESNGIIFTVVPKASTSEGIEAAKVKFGRLMVDSTRCAEYLRRISSFRRGWDEKREVFLDTYIHDWASHAGTATFYWGLTPDPVYSADEGDFNLYSTSFN